MWERYWIGSSVINISTFSSTLEVRNDHPVTSLSGCGFWSQPSGPHDSRGGWLAYIVSNILEKSLHYEMLAIVQFPCVGFIRGLISDQYVKCFLNGFRDLLAGGASF